MPTYGIPVQQMGPSLEISTIDLGMPNVHVNVNGMKQGKLMHVFTSLAPPPRPTQLGKKKFVMNVSLASLHPHPLQ